MSSSKVEHEESQLADTSEETEKNDPLLKFPGTEFKTDSGSSNPNIGKRTTLEIPDGVVFDTI